MECADGLTADTLSYHRNYSHYEDLHDGLKTWTEDDARSMR